MRLTKTLPIAMAMLVLNTAAFAAPTTRETVPALAASNAGGSGQLAMATREPQAGHRGHLARKPAAKDEFRGFSGDFLGAELIFWNGPSPWLKTSR
ncbi:hypothetical protein DEM27_04485 [Metarhizobium album]|uniref:Uncharacterized protein n=1 Tax=Metarhizobium album TaxID=2182425 RepID=A0A2U2DUC1_9HYPH|nr:hypothetical protein [Rhizobium album]PWE56908.1 hypothetical protein DEM27_04485 [Rhizobium album]